MGLIVESHQRSRPPGPVLNNRQSGISRIDTQPPSGRRTQSGTHEPTHNLTMRNNQIRPRNRSRELGQSPIREPRPSLMLQRRVVSDMRERHRSKLRRQLSRRRRVRHVVPNQRGNRHRHVDQRRTHQGGSLGSPPNRTVKNPGQRHRSEPLTKQKCLRPPRLRQRPGSFSMPSKVKSPHTLGAIRVAATIMRSNASPSLGS